MARALWSVPWENRVLLKTKKRACPRMCHWENCISLKTKKQACPCMGHWPTRDGLAKYLITKMKTHGKSYLCPFLVPWCNNIIFAFAFGAFVALLCNSDTVTVCSNCESCLVNKASRLDASGFLFLGILSLCVYAFLWWLECHLAAAQFICTTQYLQGFTAAAETARFFFNKLQ